jgi:hypothetical protein
MHKCKITHTKTKCATPKSLFKKIAHKILTNIENQKQKNHTIVKQVGGNFAKLGGVRSLGEEKTS